MSDRLNALRGIAVPLCAAALASILFRQPAIAATHEQIVERCKQAFLPQIHACVVGKLGGPPRNASGPDLERARQQCGPPLVRPCVQREEQKEAVGKPPPAAPTDQADIAPPGAVPVQPTFIAPPRTIADITSILDSAKPDAAQIATRKQDAEAAPPANASAEDLAEFYLHRASARALLARNKDALADALQGLTVGKSGVDLRTLARLRQLAAQQDKILGDPKSAVGLLDLQIRQGFVPGRQGTVINAMTAMTQAQILMGDVSQAATYAGRAEAMVQEARGSPNPNWRAAYSKYGKAWEGDADTVRGMVFEARGQYAEAETAYRRAEAFERDAVNDIPKFDPPRPRPEQLMQLADMYLLAVARNEQKQEKLSEAEADARRALLGVLKAQGKYSPAAPQFIVGLAGILVEEGRYAGRRETGAFGARCAAHDRHRRRCARKARHSGAARQHSRAAAQDADAAAVYAELDKAMAQWPPQRREAFELNGSRIMSLYASGQLDAGIAAAQALVKRQVARTGENTAMRPRRTARWPWAMRAPGATPMPSANSRRRSRS